MLDVLIQPIHVVASSAAALIYSVGRARPPFRVPRTDETAHRSDAGNMAESIRADRLECSYPKVCVLHARPNSPPRTKLSMGSRRS